MSTTLLHELTSTRRDLHQIPEIGFDLFKTHAYLNDKLQSFGYETHTVADSGLIAIKKGQSDTCIAYRADMDALNIKEETDAAFASIHPGRMHACGHDGHMAMLLSFARIMSEKTLDKTVMFIFEPAEETYGGAREIVKTDIFKNAAIEAIFALHLQPELEEGKLGLTDGIMTAQDGDFDMKITGKNAHGTQPHLGSDVALAASALIMQYHTIIGRSMNPLTPASVNVGTLSLGEGRNIIAHEAYLSGSIRAFDHSSFSLLKQRMRQIDQGIETAYNVTIQNDIVDLHPPVSNDHTLFTTFKESLTHDEYTLLDPQMLAEDFSYYQQEVPGLFIMLGSKNIPKGFVYPLHSNQFNFDEKVLVRGVETLLHIAKTFKVL